MASSVASRLTTLGANILHPRFIEHIDSLDPKQWNRLRDPDMPFLRHEFLAALEHSGSVSKQTGWQPRHYAKFHPNGTLQAVAPQYIKEHSYGEYVFDWAWADFYQRYNHAYYPKLISAIPFTPCSGQRLLLGDEEALGPEQVRSLWRDYEQQVIAFCKQAELSSWHILFPSRPKCISEEFALSGSSSALLTRHDVQFHWHNRDFANFDNFLDSLTSRKRKNIRKERHRMQQAGFNFRWLTGPEIEADDWQHFYAFYQATYLKRGQQGYLNRAFFEEILANMPGDIRLLMVSNGTKKVAAALFFIGQQSFYGRYWGCLDDYSGLHFETCYYQGIEYCIEHNLQRFDAGAQGEHKTLRGFEPMDTVSWHWLKEPVFRDAIADFLQRERQHIASYKNQVNTLLPYKCLSMTAKNPRKHK